ncbi:tripartite tricarboxylate transporter TctB family protein [Chelativorans sp. YIM 93263]|uniref:tripartite tricarboxylate transporter TctB family protein n=1 Tax=Chelativorans sp. YIM 93263 TaxID=2906648 RepID=UPI00237901CC|nr:tripartite tricarboxylate transporter TctB family protein [Chelativorans sp. YIM 93263]
MLSRRIEIGIGVVTAVLALLILFVAIPFGIVTPKNVRSLVLSPTFWPTILGIALFLIGASLAVRAYFGFGRAAVKEFPSFDRASLLRLAAFIGVIVFYYILIAPLGMVWASMLAFAAILYVTRAGERLTGLICAIALPLLLYAFFFHVAGVPIPQGELVRLP